jgi:hypothetical protein
LDGPGIGNAREMVRIRPRAKMRALHRTHAMDIERINAIGAKLADLTERTAALRGYL